MSKLKRFSVGEETFALHCKAHRLPPFVREHMFATASHDRLWRFDFSWKEFMCAVEIEGLVVRFRDGEQIVTGRHASTTGFSADCVKYATAAILGWTVVRFDQALVKNGIAIDLTMQLLASRGWQR